MAAVALDKTDKKDQCVMIISLDGTRYRLGFPLSDDGDKVFKHQLDDLAVEAFWFVKNKRLGVDA